MLNHPSQKISTIMNIQSFLCRGFKLVLFLSSPNQLHNNRQYVFGRGETDRQTVNLLYAIGFRKTGQLRPLPMACTVMVALLIIIFFEHPVHLIRVQKG